MEPETLPTLYQLEELYYAEWWAVGHSTASYEGVKLRREAQQKHNPDGKYRIIKVTREVVP